MGWKSCTLTGKRSYSSRRAAVRACARVSNKIRVYFCVGCGGYHVTSKVHRDRIERAQWL